MVSCQDIKPEAKTKTLKSKTKAVKTKNMPQRRPWDEAVPRGITLLEIRLEFHKVVWLQF